MESCSPSLPVGEILGEIAAHHRHHQAFFVSEHVAHRGLLRKAQAAPQPRDPLQQDALAVFGRFRAHDLRRASAENLIACQNGCGAGTTNACHHGNRPLAHVQRRSAYRQSRIEHRICAQDSVREAFFARKHAEHGPGRRRQQSKPQITRHDRPIGTAKRFEDADLLALFLHHTCHCRQAYECGNEKKITGSSWLNFAMRCASF